MSSQSDEAVDGSSLDLEIESIESVVSISSILEHLDSALNEVDSSVSSKCPSFNSLLYFFTFMWLLHSTQESTKKCQW